MEMKIYISFHILWTQVFCSKTADLSYVYCIAKLNLE